MIWQEPGPDLTAGLEASPEETKRRTSQQTEAPAAAKYGSSFPPSLIGAKSWPHPRACRHRMSADRLPPVPLSPPSSVDAAPYSPECWWAETQLLPPAGRHQTWETPAPTASSRPDPTQAPAGPWPFLLAGRHKLQGTLDHMPSWARNRTARPPPPPHPTPSTWG